ncbi:hypothetical protein ANRL1_00863 [Anaerolineae bacterium]|nr:hypothetical protein ANRL1_00863 [Anaerolineae bacterium]
MLVAAEEAVAGVVVEVVAAVVAAAVRLGSDKSFAYAEFLLPKMRSEAIQVSWRWLRRTQSIAITKGELCVSTNVVTMNCVR